MRKDRADNFTIIIPTFNASDYLELCLQDIIKYTIGDRFKVLLGYNNATPEVKDIAEKYVKQYHWNSYTPRIKILKTEHDEVYHKINELIRATTTGKIIFVNDDMAFMPNWNKGLIAKINPGVFVTLQAFDSNYLNDGLDAGTTPATFKRQVFLDEAMKIIPTGRRLRFFPMPMGFLKSDILAIGGYPTENNFPASNDMILVNNAIKAGIVFDFANESCSYHFIRGSQRKNDFGKTY